jgi:myo-inositol catabolism protein IolC
MVFNRKQVTDEEARRDKQSALVQRLVAAGEVERRQILLEALQTGDLKRSEAADLLKLVERLAAFSGQTD